MTEKKLKHETYVEERIDDLIDRYMENRNTKKLKDYIMHTWDLSYNSSQRYLRYMFDALEERYGSNEERRDAHIQELQEMFEKNKDKRLGFHVLKFIMQCDGTAPKRYSTFGSFDWSNVELKLIGQQDNNNIDAESRISECAEINRIDDGDADDNTSDSLDGSTDDDNGCENDN